MREFDETRIKKHSLYYNNFMKKVMSIGMTGHYINKIIADLLIKEGIGNIYSGWPSVLAIHSVDGVSGDYHYMPEYAEHLPAFDLYNDDFFMNYKSIKDRITIINKLVSHLISLGSIINVARPVLIGPSILADDIIAHGAVPTNVINEHNNQKQELEGFLDYETHYFYLWYITALDAQFTFDSIRKTIAECIKTKKTTLIPLYIKMRDKPLLDHHCGLIVDGTNKEIEFFDPNGPTQHYMWYSTSYENIKPFLVELIGGIDVGLVCYTQQVFPRGGFRGVESTFGSLNNSMIPLEIDYWFTARYFYDRIKVADAKKVHIAYENMLYEGDSQQVLFDVIYSFVEGILHNILLRDDGIDLFSLLFSLYIEGKDDLMVAAFGDMLINSNNDEWRDNALATFQYKKKYVLKALYEIIDGDIIDNEQRVLYIPY